MTSASQPGLKVHSSNLRVADMDRALKVYRDILGLSFTDPDGHRVELFELCPAGD